MSAKQFEIIEYDHFGRLTTRLGWTSPTRAQAEQYQRAIEAMRPLRLRVRYELRVVEVGR